jgi:prepilin-type N-terminal cleavage/methylation domain-containing protein
MKKTNGFTIIELMIVVVLIGILSGVLLGVINITVSGQNQEMPKEPRN